MALVVANETYLADLILPFVDVFQMGRVEMMSRAGRGACEIIALRLQEPRPGRAGCGPTVVRDDEPQSHAYLCLCLLSCPFRTLRLLTHTKLRLLAHAEDICVNPPTGSEWLHAVPLG